MALTKEDVDKLQKQVAQLEIQRENNTKAYAAKIQSLQLESNRLTDEIRDLNVVILRHVEPKQKELNEKIAETEKLKLEAITMKKEAQDLLYEAKAKIKSVNESQEQLKNAQELHNNTISTHIKNVSEVNTDIAKRHAECANRELQANNLTTDANKRIDLAVLTEQKTQAKLDELKAIQDAIKADIEIQKDMYFKNKQMLDGIELKKSEIIDIQSRVESDKKWVIEAQKEVDIKKAELEKANQDIFNRHEECRFRETQNKVTEQLLKTRKSTLDAQEGRLNEFKNNVMMLQENLEKQQAVTPKQGA